MAKIYAVQPLGEHKMRVLVAAILLFFLLAFFLLI